MRLLLLLLLFALSVKGEAAFEKQEEYCSHDKPLATDHVLSTYEKNIPVKGCVSVESDSTSGHQVVLIRTDSSDVSLSLTDISAGGVIIVLDSPQPVKWRLSFYGPEASSYVRSVVIGPGSTIAESNYVVDIQENVYADLGLSPEMTDEKIGTIVRHHFGGLSILAQAAGANRVSLSLSKKSANRVPESCNLSSLGIISAAVAFSVSEEKMFGCFYPEKLGKTHTDLHIIDLDLTDKSDDSITPVVFSLTFKQAAKENKSEKATIKPRNITIILKSSRPVRWYLESWDLTGSLRVIYNNGSVENHSVSPSLNLQRYKKVLPDKFGELFTVAIEETGVPPVSYVKVENANVITLILPTNNHKKAPNQGGITTSHQEMTSNYVPDRESHDSPITGASNGLDNNLKIKQLEQELAKLVAKKCDQSATIITLPIEALAKFEVIGMTLNEISCQATRNDTHWVLETLSTSCGSLTSFRGVNPVMNNEIYLEFAPGSKFHDQTVRVPFSCKYPPGFGGFGNQDDGYYDESDEEFEEPDDKPEIYTMKIFRKRERLQRPEVLLVRRKDDATVSIGDQLKVQTDFNTRSFLSLMIDQCWVSKDPHMEMADTRSMSKDNWLIYEGCPTQKNITMFPSSQGPDGHQTDPSFAFEVSEAHRAMNEIYIFCIMGLCSPVESLTNGNLPLCTDPTEKCAQNKWHVSPAAQKITRRGPLYVTDRRLKVVVDPAEFSSQTALSSSAENEDSAASESPSLHSAHVVMVGVPAEIAVAISVASFLIGAALTGMLCCIHHRKALPKSARNRADENPDNNELQLMLASPTAASAHVQPRSVSKLTVDVNA